MRRLIYSAREDRFAALWLKNHAADLSKEASAVLDAGRVLYKKILRGAFGLGRAALSAKLEPQIYELEFLRDELRFF